MFSKLALLATTTLATLAAATPTVVARTGGGGGGSTCETNVSCCQTAGTWSSIESTLDPITKSGVIAALLLVGIDIDALANVVVGITCSSINILTESCSGTTVCCDNVYQNGLVNVGCVAI